MSIIETIIKLLKETTIEKTATEIYNFLHFYKIRDIKGNLATKSSIKVYLKDLANSLKIQSYNLSGKRDLYYIHERRPEVNYANVNLKGYWVKFDNQGELFQGTTIYNYHKISKFVGILPFMKKQNDRSLGFQRSRDDNWISELKYNLSQRSSIMVSNLIVYFNKSDILDISSSNDNDSELVTLSLEVPYYNHNFSHEKPGLVVDGHQRLIALDLINLENKFINGRPDKPFFGPITVLIGNFEKNSQFERNILVKYFITANQTRILPKNLRHELISSITTKVNLGLPSKLQFKSLVEKIIVYLDDDKASPFYNEIDFEPSKFGRLGCLEIINGRKSRRFSRIALKRFITELLKEKQINSTIFIRASREEIDRRKNNFLEKLITYFNAFKCVFNSEWNDPNSMIRRNIGIYAIGLLYPSIWIYRLNPLNKEERLIELIKFLSQWKDWSIDLDLSRKSQLHSIYERESIETANYLYELLLESWVDSTVETEVSDDSREIMEKAKKKWDEIKLKQEEIISEI